MTNAVSIRNFCLATGAIALGGWCISSQVAPVFSRESCETMGNNLLSMNTRVVNFPQFGIQIEIPSNYRTMLRNDGSISVLKPGDFQRISCLARGFDADTNDVIYPQILRRRPNPRNLSLQDYAETRFVGRNTIFSHETINGIDVIFAEVNGPLNTTYAWYETQDIDGIVEAKSVTKSSLTQLFAQAKPLVQQQSQADLAKQALEQ